MRTEEQRAKRRVAKARRKRRDPDKWRRQCAASKRRALERIKADPAAFAAYQERQREKRRRRTDKVKKYYAENRERLLAKAREYGGRRRRMRGVPTREEKRLAKEAEREALAEERAALKMAGKLAARERRLESYRKRSREYRKLYPDKKREQDRRYIAANKEKVAAAARARKTKAKAEGTVWKAPPETIERERKEGRFARAALRYLRSIGLIEPQKWGLRLSPEAPRAALAYVRQQGLLPDGSP